MSVWEGDLYPGGRPASVYTLDTDHLTPGRQGRRQAAAASGSRPGQTFSCPAAGAASRSTRSGAGRGLSVRYDPGKIMALVGAVAALAGLIASLTIRRRRVFVRVRRGAPAAGAGPGADPAARRTVATIGGLAKGEDAGLGATVEDLLRTHRGQDG